MYTIIKFITKIALLFYTKKVKLFFNESNFTDEPTILACNHPNSFFDAIIIAVNYKKPIYFLARGDAFKKPFVAAILKKLHLIPIYRLSEGIENLNKNEETFDICLSLLKQNQTILIFSEGICVNEWKLRSLKKGTSRLGLLALESGVSSIRIKPVSLNYSSFTKNPKNITIHFESDILLNQIEYDSANDFYRKCNSLIEKGIKKNLIEIPNVKEVTLFESEEKPILKLALTIPAILGYCIHVLFYKFIKNWVTKKTKNTVFYDSILFGFLLILYPILVSVTSLVMLFIFDIKIAIATFIFLPLVAYSYKTYKTI